MESTRQVFMPFGELVEGDRFTFHSKHEIEGTFVKMSKGCFEKASFDSDDHFHMGDCCKYTKWVTVVA